MFCRPALLSDSLTGVDLEKGNYSTKAFVKVYCVWHSHLMCHRAEGDFNQGSILLNYREDRPSLTTLGKVFLHVCLNQFP